MPEERKGPLNPVVETYGQAMDWIKADQGSRVQRKDWPSNKWIFVNEYEIVMVKPVTGEPEVYQNSTGYNLSEDLAEEWQVVG
jgi:hypothetical protein